jgi:exodeoxyribonuclease-1
MSFFNSSISSSIQTLNVEGLKNFHPQFKDTKLSQLLMHFKARNYPESLTQIAQQFLAQVYKHLV